MNEQKKIRIIFTKKADLALLEIIKRYDLEENEEQRFKKSQNKSPFNIVILNHLIRNFFEESISEKDLTDSLQKDLEVSRQIAEKISKEIIDNLVPFLEKVPEEKLKDPIFIEELSKKILGTEIIEKKKEDIKEKDVDLFPKNTPQTNIIEPIEKKTLMSGEETINRIKLSPKKNELKSTSVRKPIILEKNKEIIFQTKQSKGPDSYREPIE